MSDRPWNVHKYANVSIPEKDAEEIRSAIATCLVAGVAITEKQRWLLQKLRDRLAETQKCSQLGDPKW